MALTLSSLHVYPVKGLKGIDLQEAICTPRGLEHDRRWLVVDSDNRFLTQRDHPRMATVWTDLADGVLSLSAPDMDSVEVPIEPDVPASVRVQIWRDQCDAAPVMGKAHAWLSDYLGFPCKLVYLPEGSHRYSNASFGGAGNEVGFADGFAYLIASEGSLADLNARLAAKGHPALPMNRFRPNLVVKGSAPWVEDHWGEVRAGEATLRVSKPCGRCQVTTTDQSTGEVHGPEPLATLGEFRDSKEFGVRFGMNAVTVRAGKVRVGDTVVLAP